jgi:cyclophilin family peptidyl-prolyl cis-trans isomerase
MKKKFYISRLLAFVLVITGCGSQEQNPGSGSIQNGQGLFSEEQKQEQQEQMVEINLNNERETVNAENKKVKLQTSMGDIVIELNAEKAPITVKNFLGYVESGFYNGTIFHRVIKGFMIQGGGFTADLNQKPTKAPIKNEASNGLKNDRGTIAMARTNNPDSATCQFFINHVNNSGLNYAGIDKPGYAVFGKVIEGMDVVDKIASVDVTVRRGMENVPVETVTIISASVISQ